MSESTNTILLIADISGYTKFMQQHAISVSHAKQIIVRLLKALMHTARPPLKVAELEGDAVFFYARAPKNDIAEIAALVKAQVMDLFDAFQKELRAIDALKTCSCGACDHVHDLQLKQVLHAGNVEVEQIEQFEKLFGLDVIVVHRLLKNSVPAREYVMMTGPIYHTFIDFYGLQPERYKDSFEGVGEVETLVFYPNQIPVGARTVGIPIPLQVQRPSLMARGWWRFEITYKTILDLWGLIKWKGKFNNVPV